MTTSIRFAVCALLSTPTLALSGCDEGPSTGDDDPVHRIAKVKVYSGIKVSGTISAGGHGDIAPSLPYPFPDIFLEDLQVRLDAFLATMWSASEEIGEVCHAACNEAGSEWDGSLIADGSYDFGEPEVFEDEAGNQFAQLHIGYDVEFACSCGS